MFDFVPSAAVETWEPRVVLSSLDSGSTQAPSHKTDGIESRLRGVWISSESVGEGWLSRTRFTADTRYSSHRMRRTVKTCNETSSSVRNRTYSFSAFSAPEPVVVGCPSGCHRCCQNALSIWLTAVSCGPSNSNGMGWLKVLTCGLHHHNCQAVVSPPGQLSLRSICFLLW